MIEIPQGGFAYFASDLHLSSKTPKTLEAFENWLASVAQVDNLIFLLGDIFEVWYGDDYSDETTQRVSRAIQNASSTGAKIYLLHGNRDFLIRDDYANESNFEILEDPEFLSVNHEVVLLTHGDQFCTDDKAYQKFRIESRTEEWQQRLLGIELKMRIQLANQMRTESKMHKADTSLSIMDVNLQTVEQAYKGHWPDGHYVGRCASIIHGHTHRSAIHKKIDEPAPNEITTQSGKLAAGLRIVLPDWDFDQQDADHHQGNHKGGYLQLSSTGDYSLTILR